MKIKRKSSFKSRLKDEILKECKGNLDERTRHLENQPIGITDGFNLDLVTLRGNL